jgi:hypothetical protein
MHKLISKLRGDKHTHEGKGQSDEERESAEASDRSDEDIEALNEELEEMRLDLSHATLDMFEKKVILGKLYSHILPPIIHHLQFLPYLIIFTIIT